jgi:hypothetical protein
LCEVFGAVPTDAAESSAAADRKRCAGPFAGCRSPVAGYIVPMEFATL